MSTDREKLSAYQREYRLRNQEARREYERAYRKANPVSTAAKTAKKRHGTAQAFAAMWAEQGGRCYLCEDGLVPGSAHIDHDHLCCPVGKSCRWCRRGLACRRCNILIGHADHDPARLRRIADNLEAVLQPVRDRIACKPHQAELD